MFDRYKPELTKITFRPTSFVVDFHHKYNGNPSSSSFCDETHGRTRQPH